MSINQLLHRFDPAKYKKDVWLVPILILGMYLTFFPHTDYSFLFHIDEWFHIANAKQFALGSEINWYNGEPFSLGMERAWHGLLAGIYVIFSPAMNQWMILPSLFHGLAIISTYLFVSRFQNKPTGLLSSFLIAILPSNNTIGGPVFLIPVNLSLIFIPLALLFAFRLVDIKPIYTYLIVIALTTFLLYAHAPSAIVLLMIITIKSILLLVTKDKMQRKEGGYLFASIIISVLLSLPNFINEIFSQGLGSITFQFYIKLNEIFLLYGILPTLFFIGGFYFATKGKSKETWALLLTSLILLINIVVFARVDINLLLPYQRTFIPLFFLMSIIGSMGLIKISEIHIPFKQTGAILCSILIVATGIMAINTNLGYSYYQIIDETDYENGLWIKERTGINQRMICDPWKARAFAPIAERTVYAVSPFGPVKEEVQLVDNAISFFENDCRDTNFLLKHNISIVYARGFSCFNPDLEEVAENIYVLKDFIG